MPYREERDFTWGWLFGTYDNPPQGDRGWVRERCYFPAVVTGWKGYLNRAGWMWRNPCYGLAKRLSIPYGCADRIELIGNPDISDKKRIKGYYFVRAYHKDKIVGWEFYTILPYTENKCFRMRLGWKIETRKFAMLGFAPLVHTITPFKQYGSK